MQPSDWESAQAALAAATPANSIERAGKTSLQTELDAAIRVFKAGMYVHERRTPGAAWENYGFLQAPITTADVAAQVVALFRPAFNQHFTDAQAHASPPPALSIPTGDAFVVANAFKTTLNAHLGAAGVHFNDPSAALLLATDAVDNATLIALAEEIRLKAPTHLNNWGQLTQETITTATTSRAVYDARLTVYNQSLARSKATFADAEPVARSAAIAIAYLPSPVWGVLSYSQPNQRTLQERFMALRAQPEFATHEYCKMVAGPTESNLSRDAFFGSPPAPPTEGSTSTTRVVGTINPTSEAVLADVIARVHQFVAGLNAVE